MPARFPFRRIDICRLLCFAAFLGAVEDQNAIVKHVLVLLCALLYVPLWHAMKHRARIAYLRELYATGQRAMCEATANAD